MTPRFSLVNLKFPIVISYRFKVSLVPNSVLSTLLWETLKLQRKAIGNHFNDCVAADCFLTETDWISNAISSNLSTEKFSKIFMKE